MNSLGEMDIAVDYVQVAGQQQKQDSNAQILTPKPMFCIFCPGTLPLTDTDFFFFNILNVNFYFIFFTFYFIFKLYNIVLALPNTEMNLPQVYMCSVF